MTKLPTPDEFLQRARALRPLLRERAEECERIRRMPDATVQDFIAKGCGSQAWAMMVHCEYVQLVSACSQQVQDEIWGDNPGALISSSFQPVGKVEKVDGGYKLSTVGPKWGFSSGIDEASWLVVGGIIPGRGHSFFVVPKSEVTVVDDWFVSGLQGTGSKSFTIKETFVPEHRTIGDQELTDGRGPGVTPQSPAVSRYPRKAGAGFGIAAVPVGVAMGMLDDFKQMSAIRIKENGRAPSDQAVALRIAECAAELDAAEQATIGTARENMIVLERGEELSKEQRLRSRRNAGFAASLARRAAERIYAAAGPAAIQTNNPLQRGFRDINAGTNHIGVSWEMACAGYGEFMIGLEPAPGQW
jgi:alkylation response protein AidB-like acyl-CoA dehydrogenase